MLGRKKKINKDNIKASLLAQLAANGTNSEYFLDLVNDYCELWDIKQRLISDIAERGVVYMDKSSVGVEMQKNNPSVKELLNTNRQMLAILEKLKIDAAAAAADIDDEQL